MGTVERREREKEALRIRIVEAARDILSDEGLDALSMRAIAERIEYSPATIYLYFRDKDALVHEVVQAGFRRMGDYVSDQLEAAGAASDPLEQHRSLGRAYARFALENTAYFRVMFELPKVAQVDCPGDGLDEETPVTGLDSWELTVSTVQRAMDAGLLHAESAEQAAVISWGLVHGLVTLYLSGHLMEMVSSHEAFFGLLESAMDAIGGAAPRGETRRGTGA